MGSTEFHNKYRSVLSEKMSEFLHICEEDAGWKFVKKKKGVNIVKRKYYDSGFVIMKSTGVVDFSVEDVWQVVVDPYNRVKLDKLTKEVSVLDKFGEDMILTLVHTAPVLIVSPRLFVTVSQSRRLDDHSYAVVTTSIDDLDVVESKLGSTEGFIRAKVLISGIKVEKSENGTLITHVSCADPRGKIPKGIVNRAMSKDMVYIALVRDHLQSLSSES